MAVSTLERQTNLLVAGVPTMDGLPNLAATLGGWSARHRVVAIVGWLVLVVVLTMIGSAAGQVNMTKAEYGTGESGQATWLLANAGIKDPATELVMVHGAAGMGASSTLQVAVSGVVSSVEATGLVQGVRPPAFSPDGRNVLIEFAMKGDPDTAANRVQPVLDAVGRVRAAHPEVTIEQVGDASANKWFNDTITKDAKRAEWTVVPVAIGILLVVFGALVAALLPVLLALTAFMAANGLLALISHALHVDNSASSVMLLMGMAVGVDYCLFYLRREREERAKGAGTQAALRTAAATSGRSVVVSGLTVMVAMAGMFLAGMQIFDGFAIATISVVLIAVVGSVTVLPALLSLLGDKVMFGRVPFLARLSRPAEGSRVWTVVLDRVLARPGRAAGPSRAPRTCPGGRAPGRARRSRTGRRQPGRWSGRGTGCARVPPCRRAATAARAARSPTPRRRSAQRRWSRSRSRRRSAPRPGTCLPWRP